MQPNPIDFEKLLRFFEDLYARYRTLEEWIQIPPENPIRYEDLKPKHDAEAKQQFALFYRALHDPAGFSKAVTDFLDMQSKSGPIQ
jgi:hypothetical protein